MIKTVAITALALLALWYIPPVLAMLRLEFRPVGFSFSGSNATLNLRITNPTGTPLNIQRIVAEISINGTFITRIDLSGQARIPAHGHNDIPIVFNINPNQIAETIYTALQALNFNNLVISVRGQITERGRPYPFNVNFDLANL